LGKPEAREDTSSRARQLARVSTGCVCRLIIYRSGNKGAKGIQGHERAYYRGKHSKGGVMKNRRNGSRSRRAQKIAQHLRGGAKKNEMS